MNCLQASAAQAIVKEAYVVRDAAHVRLTGSTDQHDDEDDFWDD